MGNSTSGEHENILATSSREIGKLVARGERGKKTTNGEDSQSGGKEPCLPCRAQKKKENDLGWRGRDDGRSVYKKHSLEKKKK